MGLDCYVMQTKMGIDDTDEIWYARKFHRLHDWMQLESGMERDDFNCEKLYITHEMLEKIKSDLCGKGKSMNDYEEESLRMFIRACRDSLEKGFRPYYYSWW